MTTRLKWIICALVVVCVTGWITNPPGGMESAQFGVILLIATGIFFGGLLLVTLVVMLRGVSTASTDAREALKRKLAALTTEDLRASLLDDPYLICLREQPGVQQFLLRVERGDEMTLAREYPRSKLYRLLCAAERATGAHGRPEAVDAVAEISGLLQELARRTSEGHIDEPRWDA